MLVARLNRQRILVKPEPVRLTAFIGEMAIREEIGSADIMSDQIDHLLEVVAAGQRLAADRARGTSAITRG